jgi:hypothetical protein
MYECGTPSSGIMFIPSFVNSSAVQKSLEGKYTRTARYRKSTSNYEIKNSDKQYKFKASESTF